MHAIDVVKAVVLALALYAASATPLSARADEPSAPAARATCDLSVPSADVAAARAALLAQPEPEDEQPSVPPATQQALARYKDAIAALVQAKFECASPEESPEALAAALRHSAATSVCDSACSARAYAAAPQFSATRVDDSRHLLALTATVAMPCGGDGLLFLYRHDGMHWREALRWQAAPYDSIAGAVGGLEYRIAPLDAHGAWYVLVKSHPGWCNSMWTAVRYAAMRPSLDPAAPQVFYRAEDPIYEGIDEADGFTADADAFELRFHSNSIDLGVHNRIWVRRFAVDGTNVRRIPPVAENARDFVDEWIVSRWGRSAAWSSHDADADADAALEGWHERVRGGETHPNGEFRSAHRCDGRSDAVEVEIAMNASHGEEDGPTYFLRVEGMPQDFQMVRVGTESDPGCGGEEILSTLGVP